MFQFKSMMLLLSFLSALVIASFVSSRTFLDTIRVIAPVQYVPSPSSSSSVSVPRNCTATDYHIINSRITQAQRKAETTCPVESWIENYYIYRHASAASNTAAPAVLKQRTFRGITVGCNKGIDAVDNLRMGSGNELFDKSIWIDAIKKEALKTLPNAKKMAVKVYGGALQKGKVGNPPSQKDMLEDSESRLTKEIRGVCGQGDLKSRPPFPLPGGTVPVEDATMHCIEPMESTCNVLRNVSTLLGYADKGLVVKRAATGRTAGRVKFPKVSIFGVEGLGIGRDCPPSVGNCDSTAEVELITLDDYYRDQVVREGTAQPPMIDFLSIDTEGNDFEALMGAQEEVLPRTRYLEFEFHYFEPWASTSLRDAIDMLERHRFTCYWSLNKRLLRITKCWQDSYSKHMWSNIACVKQSEVELAERMESIFRASFLY